MRGFFWRTPTFFTHKPTPFLSWVEQTYAQSLQDQIYHHPFHLALFQDTLSPAILARFFYLDRAYLRYASRCFINAAERIIRASDKKILTDIGEGLIRTERKIGEQFLTRVNTKKLSLTPSPVLEAYMTHLTETNNQDVSIHVASLAPCFYTYMKLGRHMETLSISNTNSNNAFLATYSGPNFRNKTARLMSLTNALYQESAPQTQQKMKRSFDKSFKFETSFLTEVMAEPVVSESKENVFFGHQTLHNASINAPKNRVASPPVTAR